MLCGGIIAIIIDNKGDLKLSFYKSRFLIISVAFAAISYKIVLDILKKLDIVQNVYNNQMTPFSDLPEHIILAIKLGFGNLVNYNVAFMPLSMTILFTLFLVAFLVFLWLADLNKSTKLSILILLCGAIVASQMHIILSKTITSDPRVQYYGLMFLRTLFVALALKLSVDFIRTQKLFQNLLFILSALLIWVCIVQDLYAQRVQKVAFDAELKLLNRVIARIEQNEHFSYDKKYCGVKFGDFPNFRERVYKNYKTNKVGSNAELIEQRLITPWNPANAFQSFMPGFIFADCGFFSSEFQYNNPNNTNQREKDSFNKLISRLHKAGILDKLEPFPHKDSVVVFEDIIVFVASRGNLDEIRASVKAQDNGAAR